MNWLKKSLVTFLCLLPLGVQAAKIEIVEVKNGNMFKYLVICTAKDKYYSQNLLIELLEYAKSQFNLVNLGLEGYKKADWIIVDFGKIFVHIFQSKTRQN